MNFSNAKKTWVLFSMLPRFHMLQEGPRQGRVNFKGTKTKMKWREHSIAAREALGVSPKYSPWTRRAAFCGTGIPLTDRVKDLLDLVTGEQLYCEGRPFNASDEDVEMAMCGSYIDVSQSHQRRKSSYSWTGTLPTVTTSTVLYSFKRDSIILPLELLMVHGFPRDMILPAGLSPSNFKSLVGNGMCAPSLACALMAATLALLQFDSQRPGLVDVDCSFDLDRSQDDCEHGSASPDLGSASSFCSEDL